MQKNPQDFDADRLQDAPDEVKRHDEETTPDFLSGRNGTIIVVALVIAAIIAVILYDRFTATDDPLKGLVPTSQNEAPDETEDISDADLLDFTDEATDEQAADVAAQADDKAKADEPSTAEPTPQENAGEQQAPQESGAKPEAKPEEVKPQEAPANTQEQ